MWAISFTKLQFLWHRRKGVCGEMLKGILFAEMLFQFEVQRSGLLGLEDWRTGLHGSFFYVCESYGLPDATCEARKLKNGTTRQVLFKQR